MVSLNGLRLSLAACTSTYCSADRYRWPVDVDSDTRIRRGKQRFERYSDLDRSVPSRTFLGVVLTGKGISP